jgi:uncharacterized protein YndB with AHSA1/START domain
MSDNSDDALTVTRTIDAPVETVFAAWTTPETLRQWWGPGDFTCPEATVDLRPGGHYRLVMQTKGGMTMVVSGTYREVVAPKRLVYTWRWESGPLPPAGAAESEVTVEFRGDEDRTQVVVTHRAFPVDHGPDMYRVGWDQGLEKLDRTLSEGPAHA